jgi:hypothetical protein
MVINYFFSTIFNKMKMLCCLIAMLFGASCASLNPNNVQVYLPEDYPTARITTLDDALVTLGRMTEIYNTAPLRIQCQQISDLTGTYTSSAGGELPQSITEMLKSSLNSIGGRITYIPYDPSFLENSRITGYSKFEKKIIPDVTISGGITEFDRALETRGKNLNAGADTKPFLNIPDWFPGETIGIEFDQAQKTSLASITVDFNLIDFQTLAGLSRMQTVNTIKVYKGTNEKELGITLFGPTFGIKGSIKKVQGRHAAVRLLTNLSTLQIVGKYLKLPYWRLLPEAKPDQVVIDGVLSDFYRMNAQQRTAAIQRLLYLHNHDLMITGQLDEKTQAALRKTGAQASIDSNTYMSLYISVPLDSDRFLTIKEESQKSSNQVALPETFSPEKSLAATAQGSQDIPSAVIQQKMHPSQATVPPSSSKKMETTGNIMGYDKVVSLLTALGLNTTPADLSLWTDQNQFLIGDRIHYYFKSDKDCHVVIIGLTTDRKVVQLFPNRYQTKPLVHAGQTYVVVDDSAEMALEVSGPAGQEEVIAFISDQPFELFPTDFSHQPFIELSDSSEGLKKVSSRIQTAQKLNISQKRIRYQINGK